MVLGREPVAGEASFWADHLQSGLRPADAARHFFHSTEFATNVIREGYLSLLGRPPDDGGADFWTGRLTHGLRGDQFAAALLTSHEYRNTHGTQPGTWLNAVYGDLFGRTPDASGLAFWADVLNRGVAPSNVALALLASPEADRLAIQSGYLTLLGRQPDAGGMSFWQGVLDGGSSHAQLATALASSPEFVTRLSSGVVPMSSLGLFGLTSWGDDLPMPPLPGRGGEGDGESDQPVLPGEFPGGLAPTLEYPGDPYGAGDLASFAPGTIDAQPSAFSSRPVRYFDGVVKLAFNDLQSAGFGTSWGVTRSWSNASDISSTIYGNDMLVTQLPYVIEDLSGTVTEVANGYARRYFDPSGSNFVERYFAQDTLVRDTGNDEFVLTDPTGAQLRFEDAGSGVISRFVSYTDRGGNVTSVDAYDPTSGGPTEVLRANTTGGTTVTESFLYDYVDFPDANWGKVASVTLRRKVDSGSWTTIRTAEYTYYGSGTSYGNLGDLKLAVIKDGSGNTIDTTYTRYYTSSSSTGYVGGLKYVFRPASYSRLVAALGTSVDSLTDTQVAPYADHYFEYDSSQRVTKETVQGDGCSACGGGLGTYTYAYTTSSNSDGLNSWKRKTVETLPDGNSNIVYTNAAGQVMLFVYHDDVANANWIRFTKYDDEARVILAAEPSAVSGYNDTNADLLNSQSGNYQYLRDSEGLVRAWEFATSTTATTTTAGDVADYEKAAKVRLGETGTNITVTAQQYIVRNASDATVYPVANTTAYSETNGTGGRTTSYSYTWQGSTAEQESITTTLPVISSTQNGPGSADTTTVYLDIYGRPVWTKDGASYLGYIAYDQATGAVAKRIVDVQTTQTSDFSNLPSGWSTPTGGGLHLITQFEIDGLGRTTKLTNPAGNITYTVFKDADHEVRIYPGWDTTTNATTGPTQVIREDRPGSYTERLTMSATPSLTSSRPNGSESVSSLQTLSRDYRNAAGQTVNQDAYFSLTGLTYSTSTTLGTENTHYYRTNLGYDDRGRRTRRQTPTDTIYRTVYDGQNRPISTWVGLDDTPTSGEWSPSNTSGTDLVKVSEYEYDSGGVGDGNRTKETKIPGGSAANRVIQTHYDWRNRPVARKEGVESSESTSINRPIFYSTYNNINELTRSQRYDGDGVTITSSSGVPQAPSSSLLRSQTDSAYDDRGRVYRVQTFSVNQSTGAVSSNALTSNTWYNRRGAAIKTASPGGLVTKTAFDGAGRTIKRFTTDGSGDANWTDAESVVGDIVLTQIETQYESNGNAILIVAKERFHDESATGELVNIGTAPKARVSYTASYYDDANRPTHVANVGTNGGTAYSRPTSAPTSSDSVLVTTTTYNDAGWIEATTDPRGIITKSYYDALGRTIKTIEAFSDGTPSNDDDRTTEYTYDGGAVI